MLTIPGTQFSLLATTAIGRYRFVSIDADGKAIQATASTNVIGVSRNEIDPVRYPDTQVVDIADGIMMVEAAGEIACGAKVASDANGKAVEATDVSVGIAFSSAATAGTLVAVKLLLSYAEKDKLAAITNPIKLKGRVDSISYLPAVAEIGWLYFVGTEETVDKEAYVYTEEGTWEHIGTSAVDLSDYYTKSEVNTAISNKADSTELTAHTGNADIHVTAEDKTAWNNMADTISDNETVEDKTWSSSKIASEIPTTVAELTDSADYAKKTDIPTTLPANGGNADTVNNHTVESDVPENAVFTDTVYDDTDIKAEIAKNGTPIGCIFPFAGTSLPAGYLLCDGTSYKKTDYPALYAVIGNTYGSDTENFKVPNLIDKFIQGSTTSGTAKAAGLPNITGDFYVYTYPIDNGYGCFSRSTSNENSGVDVITSPPAPYSKFVFNASRSSSIYGNSNTVQPPALTMVYIIKAKYIYA